MIDGWKNKSRMRWGVGRYYQMRLMFTGATWSRFELSTLSAERPDYIIDVLESRRIGPVWLDNMLI
jgi:hypothetical protein